MPTDNRATAERIARETYASLFAFEFNHLPPEVRANLTAYVLAGMAHRDRTAEREAARKAWDARHMWGAGSFGSQHANSARARDRYLAAEFDAGERVTLSDGSVVTRRYSHIDEADVLVRDENGNGRNYPLRDFPNILRSVHTGADFDAVKRLAEQRGAER